MGKSARKKKKSKTDFDSFFDSTKPQSEGDGVWHSGVSAMAMDDGAAQAVAGATPPPPAAAAAAAADSMDTADYVPLAGSKKRQQAKGLHMQPQSLKIIKRGSRSTTQKKRKTVKQEKGLAHAEKLADRASKLVKKKQQVAGLKTLY